MLTLSQFYEQTGGNTYDTINRLGLSEEMLITFLKKFLNDESFTNLEISLNAKDNETAFRMAHTLKGITANLGLQNLFEKSSVITEFLRGNAENKLCEVKKIMPALKQEYTKTINLINKLG